jgi:hypothetical protein
MAGYADEILDFETCGMSRLFAPGASAEAIPAAIAEADLVLTFISDAALVNNVKRACEVVAVDPQVPADFAGHAGEFILGQVCRRLGLPESPSRPAVTVPEVVQRRAAARLRDAGVLPRRFLAIHPGSGSRRKNWPLERFAEVARRGAALGIGALWLRGPAEIERGLTIPPGGTEVENLDLPTLAGVLQSAALYLGNDSGISHLAAAVGAPAVVLFGPSDSGVWGPRGSDVRIISTASACAPCDDDTRRQCPRSEYTEAITVEEVWEAVAPVLKRVTGAGGRGSEKS